MVPRCGRRGYDGAMWVQRDGGAGVGRRELGGAMRAWKWVRSQARACVDSGVAAQRWSIVAWRHD